MQDRGIAEIRQLWISLTLLWLCGTALRLTILAVPPVIPLIHNDLRLSATEVGILTGLPSMLFAIFSVPGSLLIARTGVLTALVIGLLLNAAGGALRGAVADVYWLYTLTIATGIGVAIMQVSMPPAVRAWVPQQRIPLATAVYTNGLLMGEILPVALMLPLVLPLVTTWQWGFVAWSVPVAVIAALVLLSAPREKANAAAAPRRRWWPDWSEPFIWQLGLIFGMANSMYFATNAFLPDYLTSTGQQEWISAALTALNTGQLPGSFLLLAFASRLQRKAWPFIMTGVFGIIGVTTIALGSGIVVVAAAGLIGFSAAFVLILSLALPPLLAAPDDVHRVSAAMFTISYSCAVVVPVLSGAAWDLTGIPITAFVPIALCGAGLIALAPAIANSKSYRA